MTTPSREDDDRLLKELRAALRSSGDPAASIAAGAAAWSWRTVDAELAALDEDDPVAAPTGAGASAADHDLARGADTVSLRFTAPGATVELERGEEEWVGVVVPVVADRVTVLTADGTASEECAVDDVGTFTITRLARGPVRLRFATASGELLTDWCLLP